jgi:hypothetical protein
MGEVSCAGAISHPPGRQMLFGPRLKSIRRSNQRQAPLGATADIAQRPIWTPSVLGNIGAIHPPSAKPLITQGEWRPLNSDGTRET